MLVVRGVNGSSRPRFGDSGVYAGIHRKYSVPQSSLITLTTDFGTVDGFAGAMKGVLSQKAPGTTLVDLTHDIEPFDRIGALLALRTSVRHFPGGTVHLVVVDPGVGSSRRGLIVSAGGQYLVGPDNGILPAVYPVKESTVYALSPAWFEQAAPTFHGRDVFAPVAAALAMGKQPDELGETVTDAERLALPPAGRAGSVVKGEIIHVDRFGNLVSNIPRAATGSSMHLAVSVNRKPVRFGQTFADADLGIAIAYWGSGNLLEIAVREGNARAMFGGKGLPVEVVKYG